MSHETVSERGLELEKMMIEILARFTDEERNRIFRIIAERFCLHCGSERTERHPMCHCRNDE